MDRLPLVVVIVCVAVACAGAVVVLPPVLCPLVWAACLVVPGLVVAGIRPGADAYWTSPGLVLAAGPLVFGAGFTAARLAHIPPAYASLLVVLAAAAVCAPRLRGARMPRDLDRPVIAVILAVWLCGAFPGAISESLRWRDDARLHIPVLQRCLAGDLPPENPFLAGAPLGYFWFHDAALAGVAALCPISPDVLLAAADVQALLAILCLFPVACRRLGFGRGAGAAACVVFAFGLSPWGWARFLHALAGPNVTWPAVREHGVSALFPLLCPEEPRLAAALTKFAIGNALPQGLALTLAAANAPVARAGDRVRLGFLAVGALVTHLAVGMLLLAGLGLREVTGAVLGRSAAAIRTAALTLAAIAVWTAPAVPYVLQVLHARETGPSYVPGFYPERAGALQLALAAVWVLAAVGVARRRDAAFRLAALVLPGVALGVFLRMLDGNEYKGVFVSLVLLAPAAGAGLARLTGYRAWRAALVVVLILPTTVFALGGYLVEDPPGTLPRVERHAIEQAARTLPADVVIWKIDPGQGYSTFTAHLGRAEYLSDPYALEILGQLDGPEARRRIAELTGARGGRPGPALVAAAAAVAPRPLVVVLTPAEDSRYPDLVQLLARRGAPILFQTSRLAGILYSSSAP